MKVKNFSRTRELTFRARDLRKRMTNEEKLLWSKLRARRFYGYKFRRQFPIECYILDFYCEEKNICVELDGSQHVLDESRCERDTVRDEYLRSIGIRVIRFWNNDVRDNLDGVLERVFAELDG